MLYALMRIVDGVNGVLDLLEKFGWVRHYAGQDDFDLERKI